MPSLILKKYRTSETLELTFESVENLSVKELKENASSELSISQDDLSKWILYWLCVNSFTLLFQSWYMVGVC